MTTETTTTIANPRLTRRFRRSRPSYPCGRRVTGLTRAVMVLGVSSGRSREMARTGSGRCGREWYRNGCALQSGLRSDHEIRYAAHASAALLQLPQASALADLAMRHEESRSGRGNAIELVTDVRDEPRCCLSLHRRHESFRVPRPDRVRQDTCQARADDTVEQVEAAGRHARPGGNGIEPAAFLAETDMRPAVIVGVEEIRRVLARRREAHRPMDTSGDVDIRNGGREGERHGCHPD